MREVSFALNGKNALVTGGAGFLGKYFCEGLAAYRANVCVADLPQAKPVQFAAALQKKYDVKIGGIECDVTEPKSVRRMVRLAVRKFGAIHILHNNAASKSKRPRLFYQSFEQYDLRLWKEVMSVNIDGMFLVAREVGAQMVKQKSGGSIIQTGSIYGFLGPDQRIYSQNNTPFPDGINTPAVYSASKGAVVALTKHLATYWADQGIRVNTLTPGGVAHKQSRAFQRKYSKRVPLKRMACPEELVGALIYLASDASSYVTGQNIVVDGGLSVW